MAVYLVCEGLRDGLDDRVLDALVVQFHGLTVLIEPAGGGSGCRAVRAYLETNPSHNVAVDVEDRDFRPRTTADATWTNQAGRSFIWRRHEIENCLLHPRVVLELFNDFRTSGVSGANALPTTEAGVSALLQTLASPLIEDHAAEVLKDELVRLINGVGSLSFSPPRPILPGAHTCTRAEWVPALQTEATRLCQTCNNVAAFADLQPAAVAARYGTHLARFQNPAFLTSGDYLIDMKGKHLLAALSRHLTSCGIRLSQDDLADELLRVLERVYQPNTIYQPDDFAELAAILRQY